MPEQKQNNLIVGLSEEHASKKDEPHKNSPIAGKSKREIEKWKENISKGMTKSMDEKVQKLCNAFDIDLDDKEACAYAEISTSTYYDWRKKYPELSDKFDHHKKMLFIAAKRNVAEKIHGNEHQQPDVEMSKWFLGRRSKEHHEKLDLNDDKKEDLTKKMLTREERQQLNDVYYKKLRELIKIKE